MPPNCLSLHTHFHPPTKPTSLLSTNSTKLNLGFIHFPRYSTSSFTPFKCNLNLNYQDFLSVAHNKVLIAAGVSAAIGQLSKPITGLILYGRPFDIKSIIQAGGFPSTHSSLKNMVCGEVVMVGSWGLSSGEGEAVKAGREAVEELRKCITVSEVIMVVSWHSWGVDNLSVEGYGWGRRRRRKTVKLVGRQ